MEETKNQQSQATETETVAEDLKQEQPTQETKSTSSEKTYSA